MKRDHAKDLRYSQKIKETECFIQADSLLKKIRKFDAGKEQIQKKLRLEELPSIDAEVKMREIEYFWKEGWQYDHTHPTFMQPRITIPKFYIEGENCHESLVNYYQLLKKFVNKLKIQHQDQTLYRIRLEQYPFTYKQQPQQETVFYRTAEKALNHLLKLFKKISYEMKLSFEQSKIEAGQLMMEDLDPLRVSNLNFVNSICSLLTQEGMQNQSHPNKGAIEIAYSQTIKFMTFFTQKALQIKEGNMCAQIIAVQPYLGELTYILHPLCYSLYSLFIHQQLLRSAQKRRGKVYDQQLEKNPLIILHQEFEQTGQLPKIKDNLRIQEYRHSKIILLNMDGYQSEFNLQFLRNFTEHIMYISFPKHESKVEDQTYNSRFYKKLMFNFTKSELDLFGCDQDDQAFTQTLKREQLLENPEKYHQIIKQIYRNDQNYEQFEDFNKNLFVFPLNIHALKPQSNRSKSQIEGNQSYFIRYLFRNHLFSQMLKFRPKMILISYSGKIKIENQHFLEIIQQTSKICSRLLFFPNFTTALIRQTMYNYFDNYETMPAYDKIFCDVGSQIILPKPENQTQLQRQLIQYYTSRDYNPQEVNLLDKLSIFSKVAGGHYNLNRPFEQQKLEVKLRNCKVFNYAIDLFSILKNEYDHSKKRMQPQTLKAAKSVLDKGLQQYSKELQQCVPVYLKKVFQCVQKILLQGQLNTQQQLRIKHYQLQLDQLRQKFEDINLFRQHWYELKKIQALSAANNKYHQVSYLQIHTVAPKQQYLNLKGDKMDNMDNIYKISFCDRLRNTQIIKIYKQATVHYQPYQKFRQQNQYFNVILTNMLNLQENNYQNYVARPKIGNKRLQRCPITPIQFYDKYGVPFQLPPFINYVQWNYAETQSYLILYWPQLFDHIAYFLHKLLNKTYRSFIEHRIFVNVKNNELTNRLEKVRFSEINLAESNGIPRWGCSVLFINDQIFIFGGFHQTQKSYLDLQNEITTIDLTSFKEDPLQPRKLFNLKNQLYCGQVFNGHIRQKRRPSSFVRPRMEFQFYNFQDLDLDQQAMQRQGLIRFVMIGGYGQDFKTPYSLFVNFYYIITYDKFSRRICSIQKKNVPNKVIPINVKAMIKNRGLFNKANILDQRDSAEPDQRKCREGITNNNHYFTHRIIYAIKDGVLTSKIKNFYALQIFQNCKKEYRNFGQMIGEVRAVEQGQIVSIKKVDKTNHHLLIQINQSLYLYSLFLQIQGQTLEEVPLTNESIISLDTKKYNVFALVSHHKYTHNQTILATETLVQPSPTLIKQRQHYALVLKQLCSFNRSLHLHCLIVCNANQVALLQGMAIRGNRRAEYIVKVKSKNINDTKRQQIMPPVLDLEEGQSIITFFYKKNNIITSINFVRSSNHEDIKIIKQALDLQKFSEGWKDVGNNKKVVFVCRENRQKVQKMELRVENYGFENLVLRIIDQKRDGSKGFFVKFNRITDQFKQVQLSQVNREEQLRLNSQQILPSVIKTQEKYMDYEYMLNQI